MSENMNLPHIIQGLSLGLEEEKVEYFRFKAQKLELSVGDFSVSAAT